MWKWGECRTSGNELMHYGISGQKHGVRRFQNEDGTLTQEGKLRYANKTDYVKAKGGAEGLLRTAAKSSFIGRKTVGNMWANKADAKSKQYQTMARAARKEGAAKEADKLEKKAQKKADRAEAQKAANANKKAYEDHTSTKKLITQDLLLGKFGAQNYRAARARGAGRLRSLLESTAGAGLVGTVLAAKGNKKKYGKRIVLSVYDENDYDAMAMDKD